MNDRAAYRDPQRDIDARLKDLLGRMSVDEKLAQLRVIPAAELLSDHAASAAGEDVLHAAAAERLANGIGHIGGLGSSTGLPPARAAAAANALQRVLVEDTRLGIPAVLHEYAVAGYCGAGATRFPHAIGLAAGWAPGSVRAMAETIRAELRAVGIHQALAPVLDVARDARWGALEQTFGEDPYLAGRLGVAWVRGARGTDRTASVLATGCHFLGQGLAEGGRNQAPVQLGPRELREVFAEPFAAAIREAGLSAVVTGASAVDGVPPAGSAELLQALLRAELMFEGTVMADEGALEALVKHHRVAEDPSRAAALALTAGVDLELGGGCFGEPLVALLEAGALDTDVLDRAVRRILRQKFELGLFESPYVDEQAAPAAVGSGPARQLSEQLAAESLVLLKNDGVLPLAPGTRVALLGPTADDPRLLLGDQHFPVRTESLWREDEARSAADWQEVITPRQALDERFDVTFHPGCSLRGEDSGGIAEAVAAARQADVAVVCVGGRSGVLPECTSGESRDTAELSLTGLQSRLVAEVAATGTPVVLMVIGGRALSLATEMACVNAAVLAWLPGDAGGNALARMLVGEINPAGRLPVSLPHSAGQLPVQYGHRPGGGRSSPLGDYVSGSTRPLLPFGHGLSYAEFDYVELSAPDTVDVHATVNLWVTVRNVSERDGDEVVQVYADDKVADVARPPRRLVGFERVHIPAGAARRIKFMVDASQFGYYDRQMRFVVDPGEVELLVGASSRDLRLRRSVVLKGERRPLLQQQVVATQVDVVEPEEDR